MPKKPNVPYTCPRCGYDTLHKAGMEYHLLNKKRPCPDIQTNYLIPSMKLIVFLYSLITANPANSGYAMLNTQRNCLVVLFAVRGHIWRTAILKTRRTNLYKHNPSSLDDIYEILYDIPDKKYRNSL